MIRAGTQCIYVKVASLECFSVISMCVYSMSALSLSLFLFLPSLPLSLSDVIPSDEDMVEERIMEIGEDDLVITHSIQTSHL